MADLFDFLVLSALSNIDQNITHTVTIPADMALGAAVVTGALYSLYGALYEPTLTEFVAQVVVGAETNGELVGSEQVSSGC